MGTNFYLVPDVCGTCGRYDEDASQHIGKRSAAGLYCFDCGTTLCMQGEVGVHDSSSKWHEACPKCGLSPTTEAITESSGGVELGFALVRGKRPTAVRSCSSFSFATDWKANMPGRIVDEYGQTYTHDEFNAMLDAQCPIKFTHTIGKNFS